MLACIGHDLRIPITRLQLRAEFLDDATRVAVTRDLDLMARLVDGALAHLRQGRWSPSSSDALCLADFVERVCGDFSDTGAPVEFSAADRPVVLGRSEDIERALNSLIDNAIKYGSRAHVRVASRDDMAVVEVEDEGPGIPEGSEEHLMEPFTRGGAARADSGLGLGLSAAKAIAGDHKGYLRSTNSTRSGLLARFAIPMLPGDGAQQGSPSGRAQRPPPAPRGHTLTFNSKDKQDRRRRRPRGMVARGLAEMPPRVPRGGNWPPTVHS